MDFLPLEEYLLVDVAGKEDRTAGGIYVNADERPNHGIVVATGPDVGQVKIGDKVIFTKYAGAEIWLDGKPYAILKRQELLGIVGPDVDLQPKTPKT